MLVGSLLLTAASAAVASDKASVNDTARYLAGMAPAEASPLAKLTKDPAWQQHARSLDGSWKELEARRLSKIRAWSAENLKDRSNPLFYMFSGPDFLYANAFYPQASTYLLSGLEPVGRVPDISERTRHALSNLRSSMGSSISLSFFITKKMKSHLRETELSGTLPILLVYAARSGKTIKDISLVSLDNEGKLTTVEGNAPQKGVQGAKIVFTGEEGAPQQTLYYFSTDVSNSGVKSSGFLKFADTLGARRRDVQERILSAAQRFILGRARFRPAKESAHRAGRFRHSGRVFQAGPMATVSVRPLSWTDCDISRSQPDETDRDLQEGFGQAARFWHGLPLAAE